jgi:hypothetical protein
LEQERLSPLLVARPRLEFGGFEAPLERGLAARCFCYF